MLVLLSVSMRITSTQARVQVYMLSSARFHDMRCFTCTYAYVCACVASENKLVFYAGTHARPALLKVNTSCYTCASACVASETGLFTRLKD